LSKTFSYITVISIQRRIDQIIQTPVNITSGGTNLMSSDIMNTIGA